MHGTTTFSRLVPHFMMLMVMNPAPQNFSMNESIACMCVCVCVQTRMNVCFSSNNKLSILVSTI